MVSVSIKQVSFKESINDSHCERKVSRMIFGIVMFKMMSEFERQATA